MSATGTPSAADALTDISNQLEQALGLLSILIERWGEQPAALQAILGGSEFADQRALFAIEGTIERARDAVDAMTAAHGAGGAQ